MGHHFPADNGPDDLIRRVSATIDRHEMFSAGDKVLVGVSGGPDSTALLHILVALAPLYAIQLAVAHVHHGLRREAADNDAEFVNNMAEGLGLPFHLEKVTLGDEGGSIEERARDARYGFFRRSMAQHGYTRLALGHQKNDNAEAVLMHLLRGSGIRGLGGIPPVRDRWVVRPLIDLERVEIMAWLQGANLAFVVDATNTDPAFDRNRIRHQLIPLLAEHHNANIVDTLHRTADLCREEDAWLKERLQPLLDQLIMRSTGQLLEIHLPAMAAEPLAAQRRLIREALAQWHGHLRRMTVHHIDTLIGLLPEGQQGKRISLPFGIEAERRATRLRFSRPEDCRKRTRGTPPAFYYRIAEPADLPLTIEVSEAHCRIVFETGRMTERAPIGVRGEDQAVFDLDALSFPLGIRSFHPGDRITPFGMQGSQKLKKIFIDRKIPADQRGTIPLLESGGNIIWVAGVRRGNTAPLIPQSRRILKARLERTGATPR